LEEIIVPPAMMIKEAKEMRMNPSSPRRKNF